MKIKIVIAALLCTAFFLPSCGTEDIGNMVNEYMGNTRDYPNSGVPLLPDFIRYEAEDAIVSGGGIAGNSDEVHLFSGGKYVNNVNNRLTAETFPQNWTGRNFVKFAVTVPSDGVYLVDLVTNGYNGEKTILIRVNDIENKAHTISASANWNQMKAERFRISLWKGLNFICITGNLSANSDHWMNIDCIDVSEAPE